MLRRIDCTNSIVKPRASSARWGGKCGGCRLSTTREETDRRQVNDLGSLRILGQERVSGLIRGINIAPVDGLRRPFAENPRFRELSRLECIVVVDQW